MTSRRPALDLFLVSALGLFVELMTIRWIASGLRIFGFYKNFVLIPAFLGLGIGFIIARRSDAPNLFNRAYFITLAVLATLVLAIGRSPLNALLSLNTGGRGEFIWSFFITPNLTWLINLGFVVAMILVVVLVTLLFMPLGQLTAAKFEAFKPLKAYTINILGSLTGILLFTVISWLGLPPAIWFALAAVVGLYFLPRDNLKMLAVQGFLAVIPIALILLWPTNALRVVWSPYYHIQVSELRAESDPSVQLGYDLLVNESWLLASLNLAPDFVEENYDVDPGHFDSQTTEYDVPYQTAERLDHVLIVGAGTGNDVAAALRAGAQDVVAVEIDPRVIKLGNELHPEQPYADPRVRIVNEDARAYFSQTDEHFDLITFGRLDSHILLGTASSVRLDSFVYTQESLRQARDLLTEDGLMCISFSVSERAPYIAARLINTVSDVFGHPPQVYHLATGNTMLLIQREPVQDPFVAPQPFIEQRPLSEFDSSVEITTDNWPFLYLSHRTIPLPYLIGLVCVAVVGFISIRRTLPDFRQYNLHFLFLGTAFFLLETNSLTQMALVLGSTWIVNAAVIASILTMIVAANLLVERFKPTNALPFYGALAITLLFNFAVPTAVFLNLPWLWPVLAASLVLALPLFFAGLIFAITFQQTDSIEVALGSNLLGSVLGGLLEYISLITGIRALYLFALAFYGLSALFLYRSSSKMDRSP